MGYEEMEAVQEGNMAGGITVEHHNMVFQGDNWVSAQLDVSITSKSIYFSRPELKIQPKPREREQVPIECTQFATQGCGVCE